MNKIGIAPSQVNLRHIHTYQSQRTMGKEKASTHSTQIKGMLAIYIYFFQGFPGGTMVNNPPANAGAT